MTNAPADRLFEDGPPLKLQTRIGLVRPGAPHTLRRMALVAMLGWAPLAALTLFQSTTLDVGDFRTFASDAAVHARSLIAAPLLVFAEAFCAPRLGAIVQHFREAGLVQSRDFAKFDAATASTRSLLDSMAAEVAVAVLAYVLIAGLLLTISPEIVPAWHKSGPGQISSYSPAGWWHVLVSLPLLLVLILGWIWRVVLWTRLLWLLSRLDLRLVAAHPDRAAGIGFVGSSTRAFSIVALALLTIVAGRMANGILHEGASPFAFKFMIAGGIMMGLVLFVGPLTVFTSKLARERRRAVFVYGSLAGDLGRKFEEKWFGRNRRSKENVLAAPDFSAATDLSQVVSNVYAMRLVPVDFKSLQVLAAAMIFPFLVVFIITMPVEEFVAALKEVLF